MDPAGQEFSRLVGAVLARFLAQNGRPVPPPSAGAAFGERLWAVVAGRGVSGSGPAPEHDPPISAGPSRARNEAECEILAARLLDGADHPLLAVAAKQLVKACLYPELATCRDSFRAVAADGTCRRQELARGRGRVSGAHCVDCPHWIALAPGPHEAFLRREWRGAVQDFADQRNVFLPEDFRALRRWLHARARLSSSGAQ